MKVGATPLGVRLTRLAALIAVAAGATLAAGSTTSAVTGPEPGFTVTSTVTSLPACLTPAELALDVDRCLTYTVHNPQPSPITVLSLRIDSVSAPTTCDASDLDLSRTSFNGVLDVPANGTASVSVPIALVDLPSNQDDCQSTTLTLHYSGTTTTGAVAGATTPTPGTGAGLAAGLALMAGAIILLLVLRAARRRPEDRT